MPVSCWQWLGGTHVAFGRRYLICYCCEGLAGGFKSTWIAGGNVHCIDCVEIFYKLEGWKMTCWVGLVPLWRCDLSYYHLALSYYHLDWNPACLLLPLPPSLLLRTRRLKSKLSKACMRESTGKRLVENQSWVQNLALSLTLNLKFLTYKTGSDNPSCAVLCSVSQSCLTLWFSWAGACQSPLSMGILQARKLEWVAMPSSRGSSQPRNRTQVSCIAGWFLTI